MATKGLFQTLLVKDEALQSYLIILSQCLINPVKVSQLLFSERYISEETLDKMETLEGPLDEKKTTLLSAIHTEVSSDHKKLKVLATVLSKFEETQGLSERIISEYDQMFPDDQVTTTNYQEVAIEGRSDQMSLEDHDSMEVMTYQEMTTLNPRKRSREDEEIEQVEIKWKKETHDLEQCSDFNAQMASDILRCHYGTLAQSLQYPLRVAQLLCGEGVIKQTTLTIVENEQWPQSEEKTISVLLRAVRHAVHTNYHNLAVFASVLLRNSINVPCAKAILNDCKEKFPYYSVYSDNVLREVPIPQNLSTVFGSVRKEFAIFFCNVREVINASPPPLEELKRFLKHGYPHLKSQVAHSNSIDDILDLVNDHCTLINISCLESIVESFKIKEAETHIQSYKDAIHSFCKETKASLCLGESFKVTTTPSLLQCETIVFVLNWDPVDCTLKDIEEIISESLGKHVEIRYIQSGRSIVITCYFPLDLLGPLITNAHESLELLKQKGLIKLIIGHYIIYDNYKRDEETEEEKQRGIEDIRHKLESLDTVVREMATEMKSIHQVINVMSEHKQRESDDLISLLTTKEAFEEEPDTQERLETSESKESENKQSFEASTIINRAMILQIKQLKKREVELMSEKDELQKKITSLTLQMKESDKPIEEQKQSKKDNTPKVYKPLIEDVDKTRDWTLPPSWEEYRNAQCREYYIPEILHPDWKLIDDITKSKYSLFLHYKDIQGHIYKVNTYDPVTFEINPITGGIVLPKHPGMLPPGTEEAREYDESHFSLKPIELLPGWECRVTLNGRAYYIDHITHTTTWAKPLTNTETVEWMIFEDENFVALYSPTIEQSEDVMSRLQQRREENSWYIDLHSLSPESMLVIMNNVSKFAVKTLGIYNTQLDNKCVSKLSEVLSSNIKIVKLFFESSLFTGGIKQVSDALVNNIILKKLWFMDVLLTDEDVTHLSNMISINATLEELYLRNCNITDNGVRYICEGLSKTKH